MLILYVCVCYLILYASTCAGILAFHGGALLNVCRTLDCVDEADIETSAHGFVSEALVNRATIPPGRPSWLDDEWYASNHDPILATVDVSKRRFFTKTDVKGRSLSSRIDATARYFSWLFRLEDIAIVSTARRLYRFVLR